MAINCPKAPIKNPTVTAFALPNPNTAAQSIPGTAPGKNELEIPWKEFVNSVTKVRTPNCKIAR